MGMSKLIAIILLLSISTTTKSSYDIADLQISNSNFDLIEEDDKSIEENVKLDLNPIYDENTYLLAKLIYAEASNDENDMYAVGTVVRNRVKDSRFPNTLQEVIYQKGQYACTFNGGTNKFNSDPPENVLKIAYEILNGNRTLPENIIFQAQFKQGKGVYCKIGNHYYCY